MAETLIPQGVAVNPVNGLRVRLGFKFETLAGTFTVTPQKPQFLSFAPDGSARQVNMPAASASQGLFFRIQNRGVSAEHLNIHDVNGAAFTPSISVDAGTVGFIVCNGTTWKKVA